MKQVYAGEAIIRLLQGCVEGLIKVCFRDAFEAVHSKLLGMAGARSTLMNVADCDFRHSIDGHEDAETDE